MEQIENPDLILVGMHLTIPPLQGSPSDLTAQDSTDLSNGFFYAYKAYGRLENDLANLYLRVAAAFDPETLQRFQDQINTSDVAFVTKLSRIRPETLIMQELDKVATKNKGDLCIK